MELKLFPSLDSTKQKAVESRSRGDKCEAIAFETGVCLRTVASWFGPNGSLIPHLKEYNAYVASQHIKSEVDLQEVIMSKAHWAFKQSVKLAKTTGNMRLKNDILQSILDRAGYARVSRSDSNSTVQFKGMDKDQRQELFKGVLSLVNDSNKIANNKP